MNDKEVASTNKIWNEKYGLAIALLFEAKLEVMHAYNWKWYIQIYYSPIGKPSPMFAMDVWCINLEVR
jgi:hypothetical protein